MIMKLRTFIFILVFVSLKKNIFLTNTKIFFFACTLEVRSFDKITQTPNKFSKSLPKFRLTECFKIFKLELESQNPWLNQEFKNLLLYTKKKPKRVRILEIESSVYKLPYCRRNNSILIPESGRLHAPTANTQIKSLVQQLVTV